MGKDWRSKSLKGQGEVKEALGVKEPQIGSETSLGATKESSSYPMKKGSTSGKGVRFHEASFNQPDRPAKPIIKKNPYPAKPGAAR